MRDLKIPEKEKTGSGSPPSWQADFVHRWKDRKTRQATLDLFFGNQKMSIYEYVRLCYMLEGKKK